MSIQRDIALNCCLVRLMIQKHFISVREMIQKHFISTTYVPGKASTSIYFYEIL